MLSCDYHVTIGNVRCINSKKPWTVMYEGNTTTVSQWGASCYEVWSYSLMPTTPCQPWVFMTCSTIRSNVLVVNITSSLTMRESGAVTSKDK